MRFLANLRGALRRNIFTSNVAEETPPDSAAFLKIFWTCFQVLGIRVDSDNGNAYLRHSFDLLINLSVTILYPIHLMIGLFQVSSQAELFKNLAIVITCTACSAKHYLFRYKLPQVRALELVLQQLDARIISVDERAYYNRRTRQRARNVLLVFIVLYVGDILTPTLDTLLSHQGHLMYPGWLPFDWRASATSFYLAALYQIVGVTILIVQNLADDSFPPLVLCLLAGHVHVLALRVSKIGYDSAKPQPVHERELIACVQDHKNILDIFALVQDIFRLTQLVQFLSSGLNICLALVYVLLYVDDFFAYCYYCLYFVSMSIELLPACYYGSQLQQEFEDLPQAIFKCNWLEQRKSFHQTLRIFTELAMRKIVPTAGGIINIHLNAFLATCKMAYSLYTMIMQMN